MQRKYHAGYELISNIVRGDFGYLDVTFKEKLNLKKKTKLQIVWVVKVLAWWSFIPCQSFSFYTRFAQNVFTVVSQDQIT